MEETGQTEVKKRRGRKPKAAAAPDAVASPSVESPAADPLNTVLISPKIDIEPSKPAESFAWTTCENGPGVRCETDHCCVVVKPSVSGGHFWGGFAKDRPDTGPNYGTEADCKAAAEAWAKSFDAV